MPEPTFKRPPGWRFVFGGANTRDVADALAPDKYQAAQNVRSTGATSVRTRPGYVPLFSTGNAAITDLAGYATIQTDALPRFLARDSNSVVYLDNGLVVGNMAGGESAGASMLPFRPSESAQSWMYVGTQGDYQKFSAPSGNNNTVTQCKVGIAEPQMQVEGAPSFRSFTEFTNEAGWTNGGTAGATGAGTRSTDAVGIVIGDPASVNRVSAQVNGNNANATYAVGEVVTISATNCIVQETLPPISNTFIRTIRYDAGSNGACTIVPYQIQDSRSAAIPGLVRGALVRLEGEVVFIRGVFPGPDGSVAFQTSTVATYSANNNITGVPSIIVDGFGVVAANQAITSAYIGCNLTSGIGTVSQVLSQNPFGIAYTTGNNTSHPQSDDYCHVSVRFSDPTQLNQLLILFTMESGGNNYTGDAYYYSMRPGDLVQVPGGNSTVLSSILQAGESEVIGQLKTPGNIQPPAQSVAGNNQWTEVTFPISALQRLGSDQTKSLSSVTGIRLQVDVAGNTSFQWGGLWVGGGGQPDVGNNGAPYKYQAVPLSSLTGVRGNPTPLMNYGVSPRRQPVFLPTANLNSSYDPQIDTWELYRYGGSVTSYRFIGSTPVGNNFTDNVSDAAAIAGTPVVFDNTEPWPSIDVPWSGTGTAFGNLIVSNNNTGFPATINRWLPGTIFQVGGQDAFTLRARPTSLGGNSYLFQFEECIGSGNQTLFVLEPNVARQTLPYLWGPNEQGYFFGDGDPLRPGVVQWCKGYVPDACPTAYNLDLCPPSEPLLRGYVIRGISLVPSSLRWWALYFQPGGNPLYSQVEVPVGKRLAAPFGGCTDGLLVYFWGDDGINATDGGAAKSLTDADLYNLFPHGDLAGVDVTRCGMTFYAPDYSHAASFRLAIRDGILYADYPDKTSTSRTIVCEVAKLAWSSDLYHDPITVHYAIQQPKGTLTLAPALYPAIVIADENGAVWKMKDLHNDNESPIVGILGTFEWNGGDLRSNQVFGDQFVDVLAPAGMNITPITEGASAASATVIEVSTDRQFVPVSVGGRLLANFLGILATWTDAFGLQTVPTTLYAWQPSYIDQVETTTDRASDWDNCGTPENKFFQGCIIDADTFGLSKALQIQDADTGAYHAIQPTAVLHDGRKTVAYSFVAPFLAHTVRDVPGDLVPWMKYGIEYVWQPTPESVQTWTTQWTAFGGRGYMHIPRVEAAYAAAASVELTIASYDGTSPATIALPATGSVKQKLLLTLTLNKGQQYRISAKSQGNFQVYLEDWIFWVAQWGRSEMAEPRRVIGGQFGEGARI